VLQGVALLGAPRREGWRAGPGHHLPRLRHTAERMEKAPDAHRIRPLEVDEALPPLRPRVHRTDRPVRLRPAPMRFHQRSLLQGLGIG
jgi:hypothetical protein